jgi:hypothetical protein
MEIHPYLTPGTLFMQTEQLPYPLSNVSNVAQVKCRRDYHQIDWPITSRVYQFGVYVDEVLQVFAPFSFCVLSKYRDRIRKLLAAGYSLLAGARRMRN